MEAVAVKTGFRGVVALYSAAHFAVDFTCAFYVFAFVSADDRALCLLIYNFCAFALQMPLGVAADWLERNRVFAVIGALLTACGVFLGAFPLLLCAVTGVGNAMFHVGGGRDVLCGSGGKFAPLGVFVSPGAVGLFFGIAAGKGGVLPQYLPVLLMVVLAVLMLFLAPKSTPVKKPAKVEAAMKHPFIVFAVSCLFLVVCVRSFVGMTLNFPWKPEPYMALSLTFALALGKAAGGFLADRFGARASAVATLLLSAALFAFFKIPVCGILAVFLFNMTMPMTLCAVARLIPGAYGLGFGLLTFGLFLGALPLLLGSSVTLPMPAGAFIACGVSALLLLAGIRERADG